MKKLGLLAMAGVLILFSGCATSKDLKRTQADFDKKLELVSGKVTVADSNIQTLQKDVGASLSAVEGLRKSQANMGADLTALREQVQELRGQIDSLRKEVVALNARVGNGEGKEIKEKLEQLTQKVTFLETFLAIGEKNGHAVTGNGTRAKESKKAKTIREDQYATAYAFFKDGQYERSRTEFQNYLKANPKTSYSDNAQFWIGETYYFERKYEKAILEYEKVIKNYPEGNRAPYALFKQGMCFLMLGDKASARIVFQQVIKSYPNTSQARTARAKLLEIK